MLKLKHITEKDIKKLNGTAYEDMSKDNKLKMIKEASEGNSRGKFFKFFLVENDGETVGVINFCGHSKSVVSIAPEIKKEHRGKGCAKGAINLSIDYAKSLGYKIAYAGIKEDNIASIRLHESLGFEFVQDFLSSRGNKLKMFIKTL